MTEQEMAAIFNREDDEYIKFDRIPPEQRLHPCPDINAFLMLYELCPLEAGWDMVSAAEHDEIYLRVDTEAVAQVITEEQAINLKRCGVRYDEDSECFCVFA